ncbi:MAG: glutathione S-transferase family protein [Pseudomonadota bacterium]
MYTLIGNPLNRSFRVLWTLEELGVPYTLEPEQPQSEAMRSANPSGKAPALRVDADGATVIDSAAICTFLADRHGALTHTAGSLARAQQDSFLHFALDDLDGSLWTLAKHSFVFPKEHRNKDAIRSGVAWDLKRAIAAFDTRCGAGPWLTGDTFTVADLVTVHCIQWMTRAGSVQPSEAMRALSTRASARPAYQRADAIRQDTAG